MKYKTCLCVLAAFLAFSAPVYPKTPVQYKKELENSSKSLQELQKSLKEKRIEKEKCMLDEKCIRVELSKIDRELARLQKKGNALKKDITRAEKMLGQSEKELRRAGWEKQQWLGVLNNEENAWFRQHHAFNRMFSETVDERLRLQAMRQKRLYVDSARNKESASRQSILKWQAAKDKLKELKEQQEKTLEEQASVKGQKKDILQTTIGKRISAENDIAKLLETSRALEQLIIKMEKERKKTEQEAQEKKRFKEKKKRLPWPVDGEITVKFGKNKHPDLDTYVISNGIKIKSSGSSDVKAVARGDVLYAGEFRSYGQMIIIDHGGGFYSIYGQLSELFSKEGQSVQEGAVLGKINGGPRPVLYFEVRSENQAEDPELWLK